MIGHVGSGKSSLISAILGEMHCVKGEVKIFGEIAYTSQNPWILNTTVENNILFGLPYDEEHYNRVVDAAALVPDFGIPPAGDRKSKSSILATVFFLFQWSVVVIREQALTNRL